MNTESYKNRDINDDFDPKSKDNFDREQNIALKAGVKDILKRIIPEDSIHESKKECGKYILEASRGPEDFQEVILVMANAKKGTLTIFSSSLKPKELKPKDWKEKEKVEKAIMKAFKRPILRSKTDFRDFYPTEKNE